MPNSIFDLKLTVFNISCSFMGKYKNDSKLMIDIEKKIKESVNYIPTYANDRANYANDKRNMRNDLKKSILKVKKQNG